MVPDLRIEDRGRIRGLGHERVARVDVAVATALAPLPVRGQEVERVGNGRPRRSFRARSRRERSRSFDRYRSRRGSSRSRSSDMIGRGLLTATARVVGERVPLPAGEKGVTARGHPLSRIARLTARGQAGDYLAPLPACGPRRMMTGLVPSSL